MLRMNTMRTATSIAIQRSTKDKLDKNKALGQCYNGFICELIDMWERPTRKKHIAKHAMVTNRKE